MPLNRRPSSVRDILFIFVCVSAWQPTGIFFFATNIKSMAKHKKERIVLQQGDEEINISYDSLRSAVLVLRAINHELRRNIVNLLEKKDRMTVTQIYIKLRIEQSVASQHLAILRKAGIVQPHREGKYIYYSLEKNRLSQIADLVTTLSD